MTDYEVYDKFFADEEYELENAPAYEYSYRSGWNNGLKRAAILISDEIRPQGEWEEINERIGTLGEDNIYTSFKCPFCGHVDLIDNNYCGNCGADMRGKEK